MKRAVSVLFAVVWLVLLTSCATAPAGARSGGDETLPADPAALPFGIMRFFGPPAMDRAPRPRPLPPRDALLVALERNPAAEAVVRFTVTARGKVRGGQVVRSNDDAFAQLAKAFVDQLRFRPAQADGRSVACDVEMPFGRNE